MQQFMIPDYMYSTEFWLLTTPVLLSFFLLGMVLKPKGAREVIQSAKPSEVTSVLQSASDAALGFLEAENLSDSDIEACKALGRVFRERGEFDKAVALHKSVLQHPDLNEEQHRWALLALAKDFKGAGLTTHAEESLHQLVELKGDTPEKLEAYRLLTELYERQGKWAEALTVRNRLRNPNMKQKRTHALLMHKQGQELLKQNKEEEAQKLFEKALKLDSRCLAAAEDQVQLLIKQARYAEAQDVLREAQANRPDLFYILEPYMADAFKEDEQGMRVLWHAAALHPKAHWRSSVSFAQFLEEQGETEDALKILRRAYEQNPTTIETANALSQLLTRKEENKEALLVLHQHLNEKISFFPLWQCDQCGFSSNKLFWRCPQCSKWDSVRAYKHK